MTAHIFVNQAVISIANKSWGFLPVFSSLLVSHTVPGLSTLPSDGFKAKRPYLLALLSVREVHIRKTGHNRLKYRNYLIFP